MHYTPINMGRLMTAVALSPDAYNALPSDLKLIVDDVSRDVEEEALGAQRSVELDGIMRLLEYHQLTREAWLEWADAADAEAFREEFYPALLEEYYPGENMWGQVKAEIAQILGE